MARRRIVTAIIITLLVIAVALVLGADGPEPAVAEKKALVYDSLGREYPNQDLINSLVTMLREAGYNVTLVQGRDAGLAPLKRLGEYDLVIIRAHGAYNGDPSTGRPLGAYIYTGLLYEEAREMLGARALDRLLRSGDLALGAVPPPGYTGDPRGLPLYIAASPQFIERHLKQARPGAVIIFTGCYGMEDDRLASVFLEAGAKAYIGWRGNVSWGISDVSLEELVKLLLDGHGPGEAVRLLPEDLRVDPFTGATLLVAEKR